LKKKFFVELRRDDPLSLQTEIMRFCFFRCIALIVLVVGVVCARPVRVGPFVGESDGSVDRFLGIRYATAQRFEKPIRIDYSADGDSVDATEFGAPCHSLVARNGFLRGDPLESEADVCLSINVFVPSNSDARATAASLPVMVFVHGGAFVLGSSKHNITTPEPSLFVRDAQVVYVSFNYRLGPFGFLYAPGITPNLGFHDQLEALRWVRRHIAMFGGDASRVTLAGQSAGAISNCFLLTSPVASQLFNAVILQSSLCDYQFDSRKSLLCCTILISSINEYEHDYLLLSYIYYFIVEQGFETTKAAMRVLNCSDVDCLRLVDAEELKNSLPQRRGTLWGTGYLWFPLISTHDDILASDFPIKLIQQGKHNLEKVTMNVCFLSIFFSSQ
jgi:acetyl esterase/lipase